MRSIAQVIASDEFACLRGAQVECHLSACTLRVDGSDEAHLKPDGAHPSPYLSNCDLGEKPDGKMASAGKNLGNFSCRREVAELGGKMVV